MKITGSILIIIASITVSFFYEKQKKELLLQLKSVASFIDYIKCQISYFSKPLSEIYENYKKQSVELSLLIKGEVTFPFSKELKDELYTCFLGLGTGYKEEEIKKLNYVALKINEEITKNENELPKKIKVFRATSIFVGCSTVILLV